MFEIPGDCRNILEFLRRPEVTGHYCSESLIVPDYCLFLLKNQNINSWPWWEKSKATAFPACNSWLNFRVRGHFEIKILIVRLINTTYFLCLLKKNWTWACHHLKTRNFSADNFKKNSTSMGRYFSLRYSQVILVSGYRNLTAVNWSQHGCAISGCRLPNFGFPVVRTDGPTPVGLIGSPSPHPERKYVRAVHADVTTKFSRTDSLSNFLSYGAPLQHALRTWGAPL